MSAVFDTLTAAEHDTLRHMIFRGQQRACKLAKFAARDATGVLWHRATGVADDLSAIHEELCGMPGYFMAQAGW